MNLTDADVEYINKLQERFKGMTPYEIADFNYKQSIKQLERIRNNFIINAYVISGILILIKHMGNDINSVLSSGGITWGYNLMIACVLLMGVTLILGGIATMGAIHNKNAKHRIVIDAINAEYMEKKSKSS